MSPLVWFLAGLGLLAVSAAVIGCVHYGRHRHRWVERARTYAPPVPRLLHGKHLNSEAIASYERLSLGCTTILESCADERCGETQQHVLLGSHPVSAYEGIFDSAVQAAEFERDLAAGRMVTMEYQP